MRNSIHNCSGLVQRYLNLFFLLLTIIVACPTESEAMSSGCAAVNAGARPAPTYGSGSFEASFTGVFWKGDSISVMVIVGISSFTGAVASASVPGGFAAHHFYTTTYGSGGSFSAATPLFQLPGSQRLP